MLKSLKREKDGSIVLRIQYPSPGRSSVQLASAPNGPFSMVLRVYWPKPEVIDGTWKKPELVKVQ
jgi:hypothetical protein